MATIRQRKNKSWQGIIRRKGFPHQSRVFKLKSDVLKWVRSVEVSFDQGYQFNYSLVSKTLLSDLIERYGKEISPQKRSYTRELSRVLYGAIPPLFFCYLTEMRNCVDIFHNRGP